VRVLFAIMSCMIKINGMVAHLMNVATAGSILASVTIASLRKQQIAP
jgi:hypothetical protein